MPSHREMLFQATQYSAMGLTQAGNEPTIPLEI